jgi:KDO2-lipid IV(A) lauroyltransferase
MRENMVLALGEDGERRVRARPSPTPAASRWNCRRSGCARSTKPAGAWSRSSGWELVEAATRAGKGILYLTPHLGCFEITAQYLSTHAPITVLYRPPKQAWLQTMIETGRARRSCASRGRPDRRAGCSRR